MNIHRIEQTLNEINEFGKSNNELNRLAFTKHEQKAKKHLVTLFEKEGMVVHTDFAGNIIARRKGIDSTLPAIACGSHIDTVYNGGNYDGTVGVVAGLEVIRALNEQNIQTKYPIEVIVFACEESARFGVSTIGSKAMAGLINKNNLENLKDKDGIYLRDAFKSCSLSIDLIDSAVRDKKELKAFYELHIEQGPILEKRQKQVGIVTGIAAPVRFKIQIKGQASHSGTTPMNMRKDAFSAAAEITLALEESANLESEYGAVATVGDCLVLPGAMNVVPGKTELKVDIRSTSTQAKERIVQSMYHDIFKIEKERGLKIEVTKLSNESPVAMDETVIKSLEMTCKKLGFSYMKMPSGAGHDVMNMAKICPTGLIFIPSKNGLSHNPREFTSLKDIENGIRLLKDEILKVARPLQSQT